MVSSLLVVCLLVASTAEAQHDFNLLVAPEGADCLDPCVGPFASLGEAAAAAALLPDVDGGRPDVRIGLHEEQDLTETVFIDNRDGELGTPLRLDFAHRAVCPDPASPSDVPAVTVLPGPLEEDIVARLRLDLRADGPCTGPERPGLLFEGDGRGALEGGLIAGTVGYAVKHTGDGWGEPGTGGLSIRDTAIVECDGAAVDSHPFGWLSRLTVAGCVLGDRGGAAGLIAGGAGGGGLTIVHSTLLGNTVGAGDGQAKGLVVGPIERLEGTVLLGDTPEFGEDPACVGATLAGMWTLLPARGPTGCL